MRIAIEEQGPVSPLSMIFLELDADQPLLCAVAELLWKRHEKDKLVCGYRFMQLRKADQERISRYVQSIQKQQGITASTSRTHWELLDQMMHEEEKKSHS
jgi:c-di-GMP-binding flagellar brake protein YcgR